LNYNYYSTFGFQ